MDVYDKFETPKRPPVGAPCLDSFFISRTCLSDMPSPTEFPRPPSPQKTLDFVSQNMQTDRTSSRFAFQENALDPDFGEVQEKCGRRHERNFLPLPEHVLEKLHFFAFPGPLPTRSSVPKKSQINFKFLEPCQRREWTFTTNLKHQKDPPWERRV